MQPRSESHRASVIVVSDTSPLNYIVLIDLSLILPKLFERIVIPQAVRRDLLSAAAPDAIKQFMSTEPEWLETHQALVLLDERKGRIAARECGLAVSGTLRVLSLAAQRGLLNLPDAIKRLQRTSFRASPRLIGHTLERKSQ